MKFGNGFGGVSKLPGNRRRPWRVRFTTGYIMGEDGKSRQQYRTLGYYATREEALKALMDYHDNPYSLDNDITFAEVYSRWSAEKFASISQSNINGYQASYKVCGDLYDMKFREIRRNHLQSVVDTCGKNYPTLRKLRVLFSQLFEYAIQNDIVDKDYSDFVDIAKHIDPDAEEIHKPFTKLEVKLIRENAPRSKWISIVLIMIYSGVRIGELLSLRPEQVNLRERYFDVKKAKTKAGIRRVPIAEAVVPYWQALLEEGGEYVVCNSAGHKIDDHTYRQTNFIKPLEQIGVFDHLPHDTRHTCISLMTAAGVDRILIKRIVGHRGEDVTDMVYTHYDLDQLLAAVNSIDAEIG